MPNDRPDITFRPVTSEDLPMLLAWMELPHWREWWGEPEDEVDKIRAKVEGRDSTRPFIFELDCKPTGYIQYWYADEEKKTAAADNHSWLLALPDGTIGVDLGIGEAHHLSKGIGSAALRAFVQKLATEGHANVIIDPDRRNPRAIRAYEKAGFRPIPALLGQSGDALIMQYQSNE